jgi:hypothetical protein
MCEGLHSLEAHTRTRHPIIHLPCTVHNTAAQASSGSKRVSRKGGVE